MVVVIRCMSCVHLYSHMYGSVGRYTACHVYSHKYGRVGRYIRNTETSCEAIHYSLRCSGAEYGVQWRRICSVVA